MCDIPNSGNNENLSQVSQRQILRSRAKQVIFHTIIACADAVVLTLALVGCKLQTRLVTVTEIHNESWLIS